nr:ATP-dependent metallopeptidase FtsH/Yme1/Tma family protein [Burkholderia stagnalis]
MEKQFDYSGLLIAIGFIVLVAVQVLSSHQQTTSIAYSDFHRLVDTQLVDNLEIGQSSISGTLRMPEAGAALPASDAAAVKQEDPPWRFTTNRVTDDHLIDTLTAAGIRYHGAPDTGWLSALASWVLPLIVFVFIWNLMLGRRGGLKEFSGMGKSQARVYVQQATGITFDDIAGIDEAKAELRSRLSRSCATQNATAGSAARSRGRADRRRAGHRQDAARPRGRRRGGRAVPLDQRLGVRRDVFIRGRKARPCCA